MAFDLPNAAPPELIPLQLSHTHDVYDEAAVKRLALDLFRDHLGERAFDANVLGMAHLGSFDLVRRFINADGLGLLRSDREEAATRYIYRAWKSLDNQGRGLHFLRTYLRLLFGDRAEVVQLWHDNRFPYGDAFLRKEPRWVWRHFLGEPGLKLGGGWGLGQRLDAPYEYTPDERLLWLTSRLQVRLDLEFITQSAYTEQGRSRVSQMYPIIESVIPARLVPLFVFWLAFALFVHPSVTYALRLHKSCSVGYRWCGRSVSAYSDRRWSLGVDGSLVRLSQPFGTFRLGERRGGVSRWRLKGCRAERRMRASLPSSASAYRLPMIGERWRRLDGTWALARRQSELLTHARGSKAVAIDQALDLDTRFAESIRLDYPFTPRRLDRTRTLDGLWRLGERAPALGATFGGRRLDGFRLGRRPAILVERPRSRVGFEMYGAPQTLARALRLDGWKLGPSQRLLKPSVRLSGWPLGPTRPPVFVARTGLDVTQTYALSARFLDTIHLDYPRPIHRLDRPRTLDGLWRLGERAPALGTTLFQRRLDGFPLGRKPGWPVDGRARLSQSSEVYVAPQRLESGVRLSGWPLGPTRPPVGAARLVSTAPAALTSAAAHHGLHRKHVALRYPGAPERLGRYRALDGGWRLSSRYQLSQRIGGAALGQFRLHRPVPRQLARYRPLDGQWRLKLGQTLSRLTHPIRLNGFVMPSFTSVVTQGAQLMRTSSAARVVVQAE